MKKENIHSGHGIVVSISSLHTKQSAGVGEYLDLLPLVDFCKKVGMEVIQLLPINDSDEPSPYNPISSCALHPLFISLAPLPDISSDLKKDLESLQEKNPPSHFAYQSIKERKMGWLRRYFDENGQKILASEPFQTFLKTNPWVTAYAEYKDANRVPFHQMLQFFAYQQMHEVKMYANSQGIFIMGDIPILISVKSVDVKNYPQFFNTKMLAGSPPDAFNAEGQLWGFPLYNWDAMKADDYSWWKIRLRTAAQIYDLFRIDHIVGIFRIWGIPEGKSPKDGCFVPEDSSLWMGQGLERLVMMIESSPMLPVGEDLGTVEPEVREIMARLNICGTKVIRWERNWNTDKSFIPLENYPPLSLTTVSTHDTETLELWWRNQQEEAKQFSQFKNWPYEPAFSREKRVEILKASHHNPSLLHVNLLQEYLALFPELIWPNPEDERINIPGINHPNNWLYRFRPSVEELLQHDKLAEEIKQILKK